MEPSRDRPFPVLAPTIVILGVLTLAGLYLSSRYNYLLFHTLAEGFSIAVACGVFIFAWNSRHLADNHYLFLVGVSYLYVAVLNSAHTLSFSGMGIIHGYGPDLSTQLWIAARYLEAGTLFAAPPAFRFRPKVAMVIPVYGVVTVLLLILIFLGAFPACFVEGEGLTAFKIGSEYLMMDAGMGLFGIQQRGELLGWRFAIDSQPGKGSRFTLVLPLGPKSAPSYP